MIKENFWPVQLELCLTNFVGTFFQLVNINIAVYLYTLKASLFYSLFRCLKQETVLQVCLVTKTLWSCIIYTPPPISHFCRLSAAANKSGGSAHCSCCWSDVRQDTDQSTGLSSSLLPSLPPLRAVQAHSPTGAKHRCRLQICVCFCLCHRICLCFCLCVCFWISESSATGARQTLVQTGLASARAERLQFGTSCVLPSPQPHPLYLYLYLYLHLYL